MRITHLITFGELTEALDVGGAQMNTMLSLKHQRVENDVELIAGTNGPLIDRCVEAGIPSRVIPISNRTIDPLQDLASTYHLWRYFRRTRPDVVHTHCSKAGVVGRVAAKLAGVPVIIHTIHSNSFHNRQSRLIYQVLRLTEWVCARFTTQLIAVSPFTAQEFAEAGVASLGNIEVVVSGIDFERFHTGPISSRQSIRRTLGIGSDELVVVTVANLMQDKGQEMLVEAACTLRSRGVKARYLMVGSGPMEEAIQTMITEHGLNDVFVLTGRRTDVPDILAASDIFVQTSHRESLSRALVEAMYTGLPVVATDVGGTREVVAHGVTGLLTSPAAIEIATEIERLASSSELRASLGNGAHSAVADTRTVGAMMSELNRIYANLAEMNGIEAPATMNQAAESETRDMLVPAN